MKKGYRFFLIYLSMIATCAFADVNQTGATVKWGYKGNRSPIRWELLSPAFTMCGEGQRQSPININRNRQFHPEPSSLQFAYQSAPMEIINDGTSELLIGSSQTIIRDGHGIQLDFPKNGAKETVIYKGITYRLVQLHFHSPSENALNRQTFPMEIHFVHQNDQGKVLVIGVFVKVGALNPELQKMIEHFPNKKDVREIIKNKQINPTALMPANRDYYAFMGSLTTPPCTEGLQWIIMLHAIRASSGQVLLFRHAMGGYNARPIQPRNHRKITFSRWES